ncbi:unnamed protein product [Mucor circinelloides]|uniref:Uncharacterized protein n=1 Tax=Mucor circinelloides f. circinelloides (strain 1006PhL) TaxID=1220926 RepID=S2K316_MUCC1|nr:hypothetical protein HMPREF1544_03467 [Mucor circinelloides 1006PhL]KAG1123529.1 hypothetical protein G6F42_010467 [Rhizopus arrhizus]
MKRPQSPTRVLPWYIPLPNPEYRRSASPPPASFDEICLQSDLRDAKKDLFKVIVDLDKMEHSLNSLTGQLKKANKTTRAQLLSSCDTLKSKIDGLTKLYHKIKNRVHFIDREIKSLSCNNEPSREVMEVKLEVEDDLDSEQRKKRRL